MRKGARVHPPDATPATYRLAYELLGGRPVLGEPIRDAVDARQRTSRELPIRALMTLLDSKHRQAQASLLKVVGISERSYQQRSAAVEQDPAVTLSAEESLRLWRYAEVHALATQTLGNNEEADRWLNAPQIGLDGNRPLELLCTAPGTELIKILLWRMEYGVYT